MKKIPSENGTKISLEMRHMKLSEKQSTFFISSDMSSAYSNIFKQDVFKAIIITTALLEANDWRRDLILKLTELTILLKVQLEFIKLVIVCQWAHLLARIASIS